VVRDVAAAIGIAQRNAHRRQRGFGRKDVPGFACATRDGDDRIVLDEEDLADDLVLRFAKRNDSRVRADLLGVRVVVRRAPKVTHHHAFGHHRRLMPEGTASGRTPPTPLSAGT
jgi:hypothetical protein